MPKSTLMNINLSIFFIGDIVKSLSRSISIAVITVTPIRVFSLPKPDINKFINTRININNRVFDKINFFIIFSLF